MSNIAVKGATTGTGTFTLESPATNTDRVLVLPDEAGTIITTAGVPASAMPAGSVLQVVQGTTTTEVTSTSSSYIDTGLSATITPTSASSKILVIATHGELAKSSGSSAARLAMRLVRGATNISNFASGLMYTSPSNDNDRVNASITYLDSPATTSATTYKTTAANPDASGSVNIQNNSTMSTIVLIEVAA